MPTVLITITVNLPEVYSEQKIDEAIADMFYELGADLIEVGEYVEVA